MYIQLPPGPGPPPPTSAEATGGSNLGRSTPTTRAFVAAQSRAGGGQPRRRGHTDGCMGQGGTSPRRGPSRGSLPASQGGNKRGGGGSRSPHARRPSPPPTLIIIRVMVRGRVVLPWAYSGRPPARGARCAAARGRQLPARGAPRALGRWPPGPRGCGAPARGRDDIPRYVSIFQSSPWPGSRAPQDRCDALGSGGGGASDDDSFIQPFLPCLLACFRSLALARPHAVRQAFGVPSHCACARLPSATKTGPRQRWLLGSVPAARTARGASPSRSWLLGRGRWLASSARRPRASRRGEAQADGSPAGLRLRYGAIGVGWACLCRARRGPTRTCAAAPRGKGGVARAGEPRPMQLATPASDARVRQLAAAAYTKPPSHGRLGYTAVMDRATPRLGEGERSLLSRS
eukprot:scaffold1504_cov417-Prasinococcus_capsulatus_cf.AAC.21